MLNELIFSLIVATSPVQGETDSFVDSFLADEAYCLAENVYHEARNQPKVGQMAVMSVTLNRVSDSRFPNTVCEVVKEGPSRPSWKDQTVMIPIKHRCQFSWYCDGKSDRINDMETFDNIFLFTSGLVDGTITLLDVTDGATHYHADYVEPAWAKTKTKTIEIEDHIFYRWEK